MMNVVKRLWRTLAYRSVLLFGIFTLLLTYAFMQSGSVYAAPDHNKGFVRVVHASPAAGNVDVCVDGDKLLSNFVFATVTSYVPLAPGSHQVQVAPAGKDCDHAVIDERVSLDADAAYTVAALGTASSGFSLKAFVDNNQVPDEKTKVRVYHLSPDSGPVDVAVGGKMVIKDLTYSHASDYLTVASGSYIFKVTAIRAGVTVPVSVNLKEETVNSVFALGLFKGSPSLRFVSASVERGGN